MSSYFNADYYFAAKAKQLSKTSDGKTWTAADVQAEFAEQGIKAEDHYKAYGASEGLSPNAYFNEKEYLASKLAALQDTDPTWANKTVTDLQAEFKALGINAADHYEQYGAFETRKDGTLLNPSNAFDANAYFAAKLAQLQKINFEGADTMTVADVVKAVQEAGISPVAHLQAYGATEAKTDGIPLVQTVPVAQRVPNDPIRAEFGELVPSNFNPPSKAPAAAVAAPVTKPADVGGLSATKPVIPTAPVKVPGDAGYIAPPANLVDTNEKPVLPPTTTEGTGPNAGFIIVDKETGKGTVVKPDGTIQGEVVVEVKPDGTVTPPAPNAPVEDKDGNNTNDKPADDTGKPMDPTPPTVDPDEGEGDGGGGTTPPAPSKPVELTHTFESGNMVITSSGGSTSGVVGGDMTVGFKAGNDSEKLLDISGGTNILKISEKLSAVNVAAMDTLDLSAVKIAQDKFATIDLTDTDMPDTLELVKGTTGSGSDIIQVEAADITSGSGFGTGTADNADIQAGLGDDILEVTDTVTSDLEFGHISGIETVVNTFKNDTQGTFEFNYANIKAQSGDCLTAMLKASGSNTTSSITTQGVGELMLDNLKLAKLDMDISNVGFGDDDTAIIEGVGLKIDDLKVTGGGSGTGKAAILDLKLADANSITFSAASSLTGITSVAISNFEEEAALPDVLKMARTEESDESLTLIINNADLLAKNSPTSFTTYSEATATASATSTATYTGTFKMEIGYSGSGTGADLSNVYGLDEIYLNDIKGTVFVGTNVYKGAEAGKGLTIYSSSSAAENIISLTDSGNNYKDTIVLNDVGADVITMFERGIDKIDLKTTLDVTGYNEGTAEHKVALSGGLNICSASGSGVLLSSAAKTAIEAAFTSGTDTLDTGTVFAIHYTDSEAPADAPAATRTHIWYFSDNTTDGLTDATELTHIGQASDSLDFGDFIVTPTA